MKPPVTNMTLNIGSHAVGAGCPVFVIAEIGVNHDGSVERALELVHLAKSCGADAVKLQVFRAQRLMSRDSRFADYQKERCEDADPIDMLRRYELADEALRRVVLEIERVGLVPLATPFSPEDVGTIGELGLPALKIASPDVVNYPLLKKAARLGRPMLISTGAATLGELDETSQWLKQWGAQYAYLHCVSSYPTPAEQTNLCWIGELVERYGVAVGYSDHTTDVLAGPLAVAAGACAVERHLTYDCSAPGPDHAASSDPIQFAEYVRLVRAAEILRGRGGKRVLAVEEDVRQVSRQSLVAARDLPAGHVLTELDLTPQRPATGIPAAEFPRVVGRRLSQALPAGAFVLWSHLSTADHGQ